MTPSNQIKKEEKAEIKPKILVIDDDQMILGLLKDILSAEGYDVFTADNGEKGIGIAKKEDFSLLVVDVMMPGIDGIETIKRIREFNSGVGIIVLTAYGKRKDAVISAVKYGVFDFVIKPFDIDYLLSIIKYIINRTKVTKLPYLSAMENYYWKEQGTSQKEFIRKKWKDLKDQVERNAKLVESEKKTVARDYLKVASKLELVKYFFNYVILNRYFLIVVLCVIVGIFFGYIFNSASLTKSSYGQYVDTLKQQGKYAQEQEVEEKITIKDFYEVMKGIEKWMQKDVEQEAKHGKNSEQ